MAGSRRIAKMQNTDRSLALRRAITVAHQRSQWAQGVSFGVSVLIAILGLSTKLMSQLTGFVVLLGAAWAVVYATVVVSWSARHLRTAAALQETFDVELFNLPWNAVLVGDHVSEDEVSRLGRKFRGDAARLRDYYLVADVRSPYDVLFCLEQNLSWGSRVRRRFATVMITLLALWSAAGILLAAANGKTVVSLVTGWFIPSLGLLLFCLDIYRAQVVITGERTRVLGLVHAVTEDAAAPALSTAEAFTGFARQVQDVLFQTRLSQPRMPTWFFQRFHNTDLADFEYRRNALEARIGQEQSTMP